MQQVQYSPVLYAGFPVRSLTKKLNGEGGEWITAYRVDQRKRFTTTMSCPRPEGSLSRVVRPPTNTREVSGSLSSRAHVLNKEFLLSHCYINDPSDLSVANISGADLDHCVSGDLALFDNMIHVNAADNKLTLESFAHLPSLEVLELPLNGVVDVQLSPGDFATLGRLDLSYNTLSGVAVIDLGMLPALKELHLTGNNLVTLPIEMTRPYRNSDDRYSIRFPALEKLWLDDNKLSDQTTFATLAGLRKLKYLNLDNNEIYSIPQLKLLGTSPLKQPHPPDTGPTPPHTLTPGSDSISNSVQQKAVSEDSKGGSEDSRIGVDFSRLAIHTPPNTAVELVVDSDKSKSEVLLTGSEAAPELPRSKSSTEVVDRRLSSGRPLEHAHTVTVQGSAHQESVGGSTLTSAQDSSSQSDSVFGEGEAGTADASTQDETVQSSQSQVGGNVNTDTSHDGPGLMSVAPFPELETLSLINNLILSPEGVIACESWPVLKKLLIYDNPFTSTYKGVPPLLQVRLINKCGIKVVRKRPSSSHKSQIGSKAKEFKKVSSGPPPPIPKCPLPAIEPPPLDVKMIGHTPSATGTHSSNRSFSPESDNSLGSVLDDSGDSSPDQQGVFMTQVDGDGPDLSSQPVEDGPTQTRSVREEFKVRLREVRERFKDVPDRYKGYELLLDVQDDPHIKIPTNIQSCVRALQYSLKHPLVLGNKSPAAPSLVNSSSSTLSQHTPHSYLRKKTPPTEPLPPVKTHGKVRELHGVLDDVRTHCTTLETNLSAALSHPPEKKTISQLQRESKQLLAEMQACYDRVRASSLKTVQSLTGSHRQGTGRRSGTPRRVRFSRDGRLLTPLSSPRHSPVSRDTDSQNNSRGSQL